MLARPPARAVRSSVPRNTGHATTTQTLRLSPCAVSRFPIVS